jgi:hypothetical protein
MEGMARCASQQIWPANVADGSMLSKKDFAGNSEQDRFKISLGYAKLIQEFSAHDSIVAHFYSTASPR